MAEIGTRPTDFARWATGGAAAVAEPSGPKKDVGWIVEKPPHDWMNWIHNQTYLSLEYFDARTLRFYDNLSEATNSVSAASGRMLRVDEYDPDTDWLDETSGSGWAYVNAAAVECLDVAADARYFYGAFNMGAGAGLIAAFDRETGAVVDGIASPAAVANAIHSTGELIHAAVGNDVIQYEVSPTPFTATGNTFNHGAQVNCVYSDGNRVIFCGVASAGVTHRMTDMNLTAPAIWTQNYGATLEACIGDGFQWYVGGARNATPATLSQLNYLTGVVEVDRDQGVGNTCRVLSHSKGLLYAGGDFGVEAVNKSNITVSPWGPNTTIADVYGLAYTGNYLFVGGDRNIAGFALYAFEPATGVVFTPIRHDYGAVFNLRGLDTDGLGLVAGTELDAANQVVFRHHMVVKPVLIKRMDGTERYRHPYHHAAAIIGIGEERS